VRRGSAREFTPRWMVLRLGQILLPAQLPQAMTGCPDEWGQGDCDVENERQSCSPA
jgi:hypothetical protein